MSIKRFTLSAITLVVLSGCQLAPEQKELALPVPDTYVSDTEQAAAQQLHWQQFFNDEKLQTLISLSLEHNKDMQIAVLNVQRVRGLYQIEDSGLYPSLDFNGGATRQRLPADLTSTGEAGISSQYSATVGITSYELDIWGKVRNQSEQALQNLYNTELTQYSTQISLIAELANALLVGRPVSSDLLPTNSLTNLLDLPEVPVGLPSDLLTQRPDIKAAEHALLAANANIGIARAAFYPSISLTATAGSTSSDLSGLFDSGSGTWSFVPSINLPIFTMGRNQANLDVAKADQEIAVATYQQKIQNAFRETADALADREGYKEQLDALDMLISSRQLTYDLSKMRYEKGADSYLQVLDAQRTWYSAQQQLITGQQAYLASQINLYKALGGGWNIAKTPVQEQ